MTKLEHDEDAAEKFGFKFVVSELVPKDEIWICDPTLAFKLGSLTHARSRPEPGGEFDGVGAMIAAKHYADPNRGERTSHTQSFWEGARWMFDRITSSRGNE